MMIKKYLPLLLILSLIACLPNEPTFENFRRDEMRRLLSNQSEKIWLVSERIVNEEVIEFQECDSTRQLIFRFTAAPADRDSLFYINRAPNCADSTVIERGFWYIPANTTPPTPTDSLVFVWGDADTIYFRLNQVTPDLFQIESFLRSAPYLETFVVPDSLRL